MSFYVFRELADICASSPITTQSHRRGTSSAINRHASGVRKYQGEMLLVFSVKASR